MLFSEAHSCQFLFIWQLVMHRHFCSEILRLCSPVWCNIATLDRTLKAASVMILTSHIFHVKCWMSLYAWALLKYIISKRLPWFGVQETHIFDAIGFGFLLQIWYHFIKKHFCRQIIRLKVVEMHRSINTIYLKSTNRADFILQPTSTHEFAWASYCDEAPENPSSEDDGTMSIK